MHSGPRRWLLFAPYSPLLVAAASLAIVAASRPINDRDAYWHVVLGQEILESGEVTAIGDSWAIFDPEEPWTTSQWLSEVVMAGSVGIWGWAGLVYLTVLVTAALVAAIIWVAAQRGRSRVGLLFLALFIASLPLFIQTRPMLVSSVATVAVGHAALRTLQAGIAPPWWSIPLVALWANLHGQWIVAPAAIGLAAGLYWLAEPRSRFRQAITAGSRAFLMLGAGVLTPLGVAGLSLPFELREAGQGFLNEWGTTEAWSLIYLPLAVVAAVIVGSWVRFTPPTSEVVYTVVWLTFSMMAWRNVLVAMLLLLPLAIEALERITPDHSNGRASYKPLLLAVAGAGSALALVSLATVNALEKAEPLAIADKISGLPGSVRVLNSYNASGVLVAFGPPGVQLAIDGRAERFGRDGIQRHVDLLSLRGDWETTLKLISPDIAVIRPDDPIRHVLEDDLGWQRTLTDGDYILLEQPETAE